MKLEITSPGGRTPFEGDRTLRLQGIPARARITSARATFSAPESEVTLMPDGGPEAWGATKDRGTLAGDANSSYVIVDFHTRRAVTGLRVTPSAASFTLQIDLGGAWASIQADGTLVPPGQAAPFWTSDEDGKCAIPGLTVQRLKLTNPETPNLDVPEVTCRSFPTNLSLRLGDESPFWTHPGELSGSVDTTNFASLLNTYLQQADATGGYYVIALTLHSDSIAFLGYTFTFEYHLVVRPLGDVAEKAMIFTPANLRQPNEHSVAMQLPWGAAVVPGQAALTLSGGFEADRVVPGAVEAAEPSIPLEVTAGRTLAQPICLLAHHDVTAIDLHLAKPHTRAEIHLSLQTNAADKPSGQVLATAAVQPERLTAEGAQWTTAALPNAVKLKPNTTYWLVVSLLEGRAEWSGRPQPEGAGALHQTTDGGLSWQPRLGEEPEPGPLSALHRLRFVPPASQLEPPLAVQVGEPPNAIDVPLDDYRQLGRLDFDLPFDSELDTYLQMASCALSVCVPGERLANGYFRRWSTAAEPEEWTVESGVLGYYAHFITVLGAYYEFSLFDGSMWIWPVVGRHDYQCRFQSPAEGEELAIRFSFRWRDARGSMLSETTWEVQAIAGSIWYETDLVAPRAARSVNVVRTSGEDVPEQWSSVTGEFLLAESTVISQTASVTPACHYDLGYFGYTLGAPATLEVRWSGSDGTVLGADQETLPQVDSGLKSLPGPQRRRLSPPPGASSARVRLAQPDGGLAVIRHLSLFGTSNLIRNGDLVEWTAIDEDGPEFPVHWSVDPPGTVSRDSSSQIDTLSAAHLSADGEEATVLQQAGIPVCAGREYEFSFQAETRSSFPAQAEIHWASQSGQELAGQTILLLIAQDLLGPYAYRGKVPDGAASATVRFVQQPDGECLVGNVALCLTDNIAVPLTFLAETTGELTVLDPQVAYDLPEPPEPVDGSVASLMPRKLIALSRAAAAEVWPSSPPLASREVSILAGVGQATTDVMSGLGVSTLGSLAEMDLHETVGLDRNTRKRLLELKTAAEIILDVAVDARAYPNLSGESLESLLLEEEAAGLQRNLATLRQLLKPDAFRNLTLSELMVARA